MPKATTCIWNGQRLDIADALAMRQRNQAVVFTCDRCGQRVRAHKKGTTGQAAHFEHFEKNEACLR